MTFSQKGNAFPDISHMDFSVPAHKDQEEAPVKQVRPPAKDEAGFVVSSRLWSWRGLCFLGFLRLGRHSALPDLVHCSWHWYQGSGPRNGPIWNQVSRGRAHREIWRLHGNRYPDAGLKWWPEQSQLCSQGMVYLHKLCLAVIVMTF